MFCNNCGKEVRTGTKFCRYCGATMVQWQDRTDPQNVESIPTDSKAVPENSSYQPMNENVGFTPVVNEYVYPQQKPVENITPESSPKEEKKPHNTIALRAVVMITVSGLVILGCGAYLTLKNDLIKFPNKQAVEYAQSAQELFESEDYEKAAENYSSAIKDDPLNVEYYKGAAASYNALGNSEMEEKILSEGVINTGNSELAELLSSIRQQQVEEESAPVVETTVPEVPADEPDEAETIHPHTRYFQVRFDMKSENFPDNTVEEEVRIKRYVTSFAASSDGEISKNFMEELCVLHEGDYHPLCMYGTNAGFVFPKSEYGKLLNIYSNYAVGMTGYNDYYSYNDRGLLCGVYSGHYGNTEIFYSFNEFDQPIKRYTFSAGTELTISDYEYNNDGFLIRDSDGVEYFYDEMGRVVKEVFESHENNTLVEYGYGMGSELDSFGLMNLDSYDYSTYEMHDYFGKWSFRDDRYHQIFINDNNKVISYTSDGVYSLPENIVYTETQYSFLMDQFYSSLNTTGDYDNYKNAMSKFNGKGYAYETTRYENGLLKSLKIKENNKTIATITYKYTYDKNNMPEGAIVYDGNKEYQLEYNVERVQYCKCEEYDENGNPVKGTYYDGDGKVLAHAEASYVIWDENLLDNIKAFEETEVKNDGLQ